MSVASIVQDWPETLIALGSRLADQLGALDSAVSELMMGKMDRTDSFDPAAMKYVHEVLDSAHQVPEMPLAEFRSRVEALSKPLEDIRAALYDDTDARAARAGKLAGDALKTCRSFLQASLPDEVLKQAPRGMEPAPDAGEITDDEPEEPADVAAGDGLFDTGDAAICLGDLLRAKRGRGLALSGTLRVWLQRAGFLAAERHQRRDVLAGGEEKEVHAVSPEHVLTAMLCGRPTEKSRTAIGPYIDMYDALLAFVHTGVPSGFKERVLDAVLEVLEAAGAAGKKLQLDRLEAVRPRIYLTPETVDILRAADRIRGQTVPNQPRIDARHLAAAFLLEPVAWQGFSDLTRRDQNAPAWEFFASAIESQIIDSLWEGEDEDAWRQIFQTVAGNGSPLIVTPQGAPVPRYSRDKPWVGDKGELQSDPLGVVADARAMADLILLKEPGPPLAIGLFGDWGSGKSTFMDILRRAIDENASRAQSIRGHVEAARADPNLVPVYTEESLLPFVENVAHIRFNAWHYAEANLWASLAAQIFRELLTSTEASEDGAIPPYRREQIENLIGKLGVAEDAARTARQDLDEARHAANRARKNLSQRRKARAEAEAELSKTRQPVGWESIELDVRSLEPVMQALGLGDAAPDVEALVELADESRGLAGHLRYLLTATLGGQRPDRAVVTRALVTFGGIAGGGVILALLINLFAPQIANVVAWLSAMIGAAGGAGRWLGPHIQTVNAHIGRLRQARDAAVEQKREAERRARAEERAAADALAVAESAETAARLSYEEKQDAYERAADLHRGERPGELFLRLIEERAGEDGYRKHLGLVSQLHDDFQLMSELLVRQAERRETGANADPSDELPAIDRIVLYIDDLDRCPDETVVKVLEAVHLLLALPLFVVVVGVDARWLEGALERQYAAQLSSNEIRPEDYLEKIFQLPYWLRRLDTRESGSFHSLTASLLTREEKAAYQSWRDRRSKPETPDSREGEHDESPDEATDTDGVASALGRIRLKPEERETIESVREAVALTPEEVAVIGALAPLVGKSPRSTKRFMNLYRFEKARRMQKEAGLFMGEGDETPEYLSVMVVLALAVGFDPETFDILMRQTGLLAAAKRSVNAEKGDSSREDAPPSFYRRLAGGGTDKADTAYIRFKPVVEKIAAAGDGLAKFRKVEDIDRQIAQLARAGRLPRLTFKRPYQA